MSIPQECLDEPSSIDLFIGRPLGPTLRSSYLQRWSVVRLALLFDDAGNLEVLDDKCIGCGLCARACPTAPQSIRVMPRA